VNYVLDVIEQQKRDYTLTPLSSLNPVLIKPELKLRLLV
jgi:hypothetical protein